MVSANTNMNLKPSQTCGPGRIYRFAAQAVFAFVLAVAAPVFAQNVTQTFQLRNGWNSIWLEVEPTNAAMSQVFGALPLSSVWTYVPPGSGAQFIQNQTEDVFNQSAWLRYFPAARPESVLNNVSEAHALRPYLVKVTGAATLTVTGRPVVRVPVWTANALNLRGFPVDPLSPPTFATFFNSSPEHSGQAIYQLNNAGVWTSVAPSETVKQGEAYWVFCSGPSRFQGPLGLELSPGDGLDYGVSLLELAPHLKNNSAGGRQVCFNDVTVGANNPLSYQHFVNNRLSWENLPAPYCFSMGGGEELDFRLAMRRAAFNGTGFGSILEVKDDIGTRYLVAVTAQKLEAARPALDGVPATGNPLAGLWVGTATVNSVNEANSLQPTHQTPTRTGFDLRLIVHVDSAGEARLVKEVIQMWQNGTYTNNVAGRKVPDKPGRFVLLTSDSLIPQFEGASLRDGVPVGRRFSTIDFDFDGGPQGTLPMAGGFGVGHTARGTIVLEADAATNPFKHKFHPDHDNLDASFQHYKEEAYRVTRQIELEFTPTTVNPDDKSTASLEYGYSTLGGNYRETISGLHRTNILAGGAFKLTRVSNSPVLNQ